MIDEDDFWSNWWNEKCAGEAEVIGENLPQRHFLHHKIPHDRPGLEPRTAAVATNRLSYGAAFFSPISSPLTTRRVTVEVFDPASTRVRVLSDENMGLSLMNMFGVSPSVRIAHVARY
jgi:hypothetical protein